MAQSPLFRQRIARQSVRARRHAAPTALAFVGEEGA